MSSERSNTIFLKVLLLGESSVGKTSIFHRYVKKEFPDIYKATIGADFTSKHVSFEDSKDVVLQIWDTAGQERFMSLGQGFFRGSDACILVYDITDRGSFDALTTWHRRFLQGVGVTIESAKKSGFIFVLLGNKSDLSGKRQVSTEVAKRFCEENGYVFFETSAKNGTKVQDAFDYVVLTGLEASYSQSIDIPVRDINIEVDDEMEETVSSGCAC